MLNISSIYDPSYNTTFDSAILYSIIAIFLLSLFSLCFVFHLLFKSQNSHHLQSFNSLWSVRFLLVFIITLWGLNELFRIPLFRKQHLYPFFSFFNPITTRKSLQSPCCSLIRVIRTWFLGDPPFSYEHIHQEKNPARYLGSCLSLVCMYSHPHHTICVCVHFDGKDAIYFSSKFSCFQE